MLIETRTDNNAAYKVKAMRSSAGLGLFAQEHIPAGKKILEYIGHVHDADNTLNNKYIFNVSKNMDIDGSPRFNTARYINHSCDPNAESWTSKGHVWIRSIRAIEPGEEITYNYGDEYVDRYIKPYGCRCGKCNS
jgi:SET domain-containing protein